MRWISATAMLAVLAVLAGCGEVVVFGHVVREAPTKAEPDPSSSSPSPLATASAVAPAPAPPAKHPVTKQVATARVVKRVTISVAPAAVAKMSSSTPAFSADALLTEIESQLVARKLLDEQSSQVVGTAAITIEDLTAGPSVNAIVFGYRMMAGTLTGTIRVADAGSGAPLETKIVADSRWRVAADANEDDHPLSQLYHRFAVLAGDRLAGIASSPDESVNDQPR